MQDQQPALDRAEGRERLHLNAKVFGTVPGQTIAAPQAERIARRAGFGPAEAARMFGASPLRHTARDKRALVTNFDDIDRLAQSLQRHVTDG